MNYPQSLAYLDLLSEVGIKAGLDHTCTLARGLGNPQGAFPSILVAGTNGKGSVSAMLASILGAASFRVGLYTSPHLVDVRERVRVAGEMPGQDRFAALLSEVRRCAESALESGSVEEMPTHFEALTLLAFLHFAESEVDLAVLEVGLGGRWDCTNIVDPILSLVTSISRDHEEWLGKGLRNIAREKAGILRKGVPALTSATRPEAVEVIAHMAREVGAPLGLPGEVLVDRRGATWSLTCPEGGLDGLPDPVLPGEHQLENATLACRAALALRAKGWPIGDGAVREGLRSTCWPGRLQKIREAPDTYLDGAHNPEGCEVLRRFAEGLPRPRMLVFAAMRDKPLEEMAVALFPAFDAVVATRVPAQRCAPAESIPIGGGGRPDFVEPDPVCALARATALAGPGGSVVVAGSLYLVGHVMGALGMCAGGR